MAETPARGPAGRRLDDFWRRHPGLMLLAVIALACVATVLLLARSEGQVVLYQRF